MAISKRLSARAVASLSKPGRHADGEGLYLVIDKAGAKRWVMLFRFDGRSREMGLGSLSRVSLALAREMAVKVREQLARGVDPIRARNTEKGVVTFGEAADQLVADLSPQWRNEKHKAQWSTTFTTHCAKIRNINVEVIDTRDVLAALQPIWTATPETASRVRGRIERVLDASKAKGWRTGDNPARWRGHLDHLLPRRAVLSRGHHAALPYAELPSFVRALRAREAMSARALEFLVFTVARTSEVLRATWSEIDADTGVWTVPAARMKAARERRVPLTPAALAVLEKVVPFRQTDEPAAFIFPGSRPGAPLSNMAMEMNLRRMNLDAVIVPGFRSTFRDWAGEETEFARETAEAALAHIVGDATERAYRRGDALGKRRLLMQAWADFTNTERNSEGVAKKG